MELPYAYPRALLPQPPEQTEDAETEIKEAKHPVMSVADKLADTWKVYSTLVQDEVLWKIINEPRDEGSDVFYLQRVVVQTADLLGRILAGPPTVMDELKALMDQMSTEQSE